ncbi:MAG: aromatic ring-hydroxylating dioxygenase subunit alpha [Burkholderiaceae bacterium]
MTTLTDHWYIACASSQLDNEPRSTLVLEHPIALYRTREGKPCALEDRCCHRGVQLSLGTLTGDGTLACRYHGWQYDETGRCVHVPSLCSGANVPAGFRVRAYPCVEQDHYVWVWMGDGAPATEAPPAIRGLHDYAWTQGVIEADCGMQPLIDNILDASHLPFVHAGTHWSYFLNKLYGFKEYEYEVRVGDGGLAVFYPAAADESTDHLAPDVASYLELSLPNRLYVFQRGVKSDFYLVFHMVPCGPDKTRTEWLMRTRERKQGVEWTGAENITLQQDRAIVESAWRNNRRPGADVERSVPADFPQLMARKILAHMRAGEWPAKKSELVQRKLVLVRQ